MSDKHNYSKHKENNKSSNDKSPSKPKNRTLQYYKFLHYAMKTEIKYYEFHSLAKWCSHVEVLSWIASIILYFSAEEFKTAFPWLNTIHLARGIIGYIILVKLPRSYEFLNKIDIDYNTAATQEYNYIMRDQVKKHFLKDILDMKCWLVTYFSLTFANFIIDIIHFIYCVASLDDKDQKLSDQLDIVTFLLISIIFMCKETLCRR